MTTAAVPAGAIGTGLGQIDPALLDYTPVTYGPVWERAPDSDRYALPEHTLGWLVLAWILTYLQDPETGGPIDFTESQIRRLLWFYAVDESGRFLFKEWMFVGHRGSGKSWFGMIVAAVELVGPCRFGGWVDGAPTAVENRVAWVQIVGTGQDATRNASMYVPFLFTAKAVKKYKIQISKTMIYSRGRRLEFVSNSARALMGGRPTFVMIDEPHLMVYAEDHEMYRTVADNAAKGAGRTRVMLTTNCWATDEDSVAQRRFESYEQSRETGLTAMLGNIVDMIAAPSHIPVTPDTVESLLRASFADHHWMDLATIIQTALDPGRSMADLRRFWLSQPVAADEAMFSLTDWEIGLSTDESAVLVPGDEIVLGCDPSLRDDATALVAIRLADGMSFPLHVQQPAKGSEISREALDGAVANAFSDYSVSAFFCDLMPLTSYVDKWALEYGAQLSVQATSRHAIGWSMQGGGRELAEGVARFMEDLAKGDLLHPDSPVMKRHLLNTRRRGTRWGTTIAKEAKDSPKKIDVTAAWLLANMARRKLLFDGKRPKSKRLVILGG